MEQTEELELDNNKIIEDRKFESAGNILVNKFEKLEKWAEETSKKLK